MEEDSRGSELSNVIRIDDERVREHLGRIVRGTVEETLNAMLEAEEKKDPCVIGSSGILCAERTKSQQGPRMREPATSEHRSDIEEELKMRDAK